MTDLVLHSRTAGDIESLSRDSSHALLLVGPDGVGKYSIARSIVEIILGRDSENYPYIEHIEPDNGTIKIESIRELRQFLRLKLPVKAAGLQRFVIIEHADAMTPEAQNALLKTLEEPPADTLLILTAAAERSLLETVLSRVQIMTILPPARDQLIDYFANRGDADKAYSLSGGLPGLMAAIIDGKDDHDLAQTAETARTILTAKPYDRLKLVDKLAKTPEQAASLLAIIGRMADTALKNGRQDSVSIKRWHGILKSVNGAEAALARNAQTKLVLLDFFLNI